MVGPLKMKLDQGKEIPKLVEPQCSVLQAEVWAGKLLTLEGKRRDSRSDNAYILIFADLEDAEKFAQSRVDEDPDVECSDFRSYWRSGEARR